jgi:hypothetical protein
MVTAMNNDKTLRGCFGMYPSFVAGILSSARRIHFFVLCNEELNYEKILKCVLVTNSVVFVTSHMQDIISNYRIKAKQFLFPFKQDYF